MAYMLRDSLRSQYRGHHVGLQGAQTTNNPEQGLIDEFRVKNS